MTDRYFGPRIAIVLTACYADGVTIVTSYGGIPPTGHYHIELITTLPCIHRETNVQSIQVHASDYEQLFPTEFPAYEIQRAYHDVRLELVRIITQPWERTPALAWQNAADSFWTLPRGIAAGSYAPLSDVLTRVIQFLEREVEAALVEEERTSSMAVYKAAMAAQFGRISSRVSDDEPLQPARVQFLDRALRVIPVLNSVGWPSGGQAKRVRVALEYVSPQFAFPLWTCEENNEQCCCPICTRSYSDEPIETPTHCLKCKTMLHPFLVNVLRSKSKPAS